jgi:hypothetical protein
MPVPLSCESTYGNPARSVVPARLVTVAFRQNMKSYISSNADAAAGTCCHHVANCVVKYLISTDFGIRI